MLNDNLNNNRMNNMEEMKNNEDSTTNIIKYIEWTCLLLENLSTKELDFDMNLFQNTLNKVENNLSRMPSTKLGIKQVNRCVKILKLLVEGWKSKIENNDPQTLK